MHGSPRRKGKRAGPHNCGDELRWCCDRVVTTGRPSPQPSPSGRGRKSRPIFTDRAGFCTGFPGERPLRKPSLVARKTPHRFPPRTADSASPLGEGEERCGLWSIASEGACWGGDLERKTPHRIRPRTADSASPPGEGEEPRRIRGRGGVLQRSPQGRGRKSGSVFTDGAAFCKVLSRDEGERAGFP